MEPVSIGSEESTQEDLLAEIDRLKRQLRTAQDRLQATERKLQEREKALRNAEERARYNKNQVTSSSVVCDQCTMKVGPQSCLAESDADTLVQQVRDFIIDKTKNLTERSRSGRYFFNKLTEMMLDEEIHGGQLKECAYSVFRQYVRDHVFTPHRILKLMDQKGGVLNYEGIELLRMVETDGVPNSAPFYHHPTACRSTLQWWKHLGVLSVPL